MSLLAHALLLLGWERYGAPGPLPSVRQEAPREEVVYLDLSPVPPAPPALSDAAYPAPSRQPPLPRTEPAVHAPPNRPPAPDRPRSAAGGAAPTPLAEAGSAPARGLPDARLSLEARGLPRAPPRPAHERLQADADAALRAHRDSIAAESERAGAARQATILGRRVPVLGNDTSFHHRGLQVMILGRRIVTPGDGAAFQELEIEEQERVRAHGRVVRERIRATRKRKDAERGSNQLR